MVCTRLCQLLPSHRGEDTAVGVHGTRPLLRPAAQPGGAVAPAALIQADQSQQCLFWVLKVQHDSSTLYFYVLVLQCSLTRVY